MDFENLIPKQKERLRELDEMSAQPNFFDDNKKAQNLMRERMKIAKLLENWQEQKKAKDELAETEKMLIDLDEEDEMAQLAIEEKDGLEKNIARLESEITYALLPPEIGEDRDALLEIRAGAGGDEASLFAGDLARMYQRFAETRKWKAELMEASPSEAGGFKSLVMKVKGEDVFRILRYESGVHRVQRVPKTETQGRIHTSTATVAVLPEAEEVDLELKMDELRIETCRAGGPGGQHVNTTDSAVQVLHIPSGLMVRCQDGRSQGKNKEKALTLMRAKLLERKRQEQAEKYSAARRKLIGGAGREEKIRTYNFPQNRVSDHRIGLTLFNLEQVVAGEIDELVKALQEYEMKERLSELVEAA